MASTFPVDRHLRPPHPPMAPQVQDDGLGFFLFDIAGAAFSIFGDVVSGVVKVVGSVVGDVAGTVWNVVKGLIGSMSVSKVTINTPKGPMTVDLSDPNWLQKLKNLLGDVNVVVGMDANGKPVISVQPASLSSGLSAAMSQLFSSSNLPILAVAGVGVFLLMQKRKK